MSRPEYTTVQFPPALRAFLVCATLSVYLGACAVAAVSAVAVTSVDIARDRRTVGTYVDDNAVEIKIRRAIRQDPRIGNNTNISVTSMNGIVLLTGQTPRPEQSRRAVGIARGYTEARQVINQITIAAKSSLTSRSLDTWITTKVKSTLLRSSDVNAGRIKVVTEQGTVYLMGVVSRAEADAAVSSAQRVRKIVRIVKVFEYT